MAEGKTYTLDNLPDVPVYTGKATEYDPIYDGEIYQAELLKVELRDKLAIYVDPAHGENGKYNISFEFAILNDGEFYGRRLWSTASLSLKPEGKIGPTVLYKIVTKMLKSELTWDDCASYAPTIKILMGNLEELVGRQIKLAIENVKKDDGKIKSTIKTFSEVKTDLPAFDAERSKKIGEDARAKKAATEEVVIKEPLPF